VAGFALIFHRDGRPVSRPRLNQLAARLRFRGRGLDTWVDGPIGLAQIGPHGPGPLAEIAAAFDGRWRAAIDGRIDNRDEVARALAFGAVAADGSDDARLVLAAVERWGAGTPSRLVGEFAIAAWNASSRELWLFRDAMGLRPLYLRVTDLEVVCASDVRALLLDAPAEVNEALVGEYLCRGIVSNRETLYRGIERLPLAHAAAVSSSSLRTWQYWTPALDTTLAARTPVQRMEQFAAIFADVVGAQRSGADEVALLLSGGLDSSSVAAALTAAGARWHAYTLGQANADDDETPIAQAVARHFGSPHTRVDAGPFDASLVTNEITATLELPVVPNGLAAHRLRAQAAADGHRIAFSGLGSDEWFGGSFLRYADLARRGRLLALAREAWADRRLEGPTLMHLRIAAWALCPPRLQHAIRAALGRTPVPPWVGRALARRTDLADRLNARDIPTPAFATLSQRAIFEDNTSGDYASMVEMQERAAARAGIEERFPFHDRRLIEFSLSLPDSDRWSGGRPKAIVRRAMAGRLPDAVIARTASPNANPVADEALRVIGGRRFFDSLETSALGWVDAVEARRLWNRHERRVAHGGRAGREVWLLWGIAAVELWWRHAVAHRVEDVEDGAAVTEAPRVARA